MAEGSDRLGLLREWFTQPGAMLLMKHVLLVCLLFVAIFVGMYCLQEYARQVTDKWEDLDPSLKVSGQTAMQQFDTMKRSNGITKTDSSEMDRLREQYGETVDRRQVHLEVMVFFYSRYYMAIVMAALSGLIASMAFLFVSRSGWSNANTYVLTTLMVMTSSAAYFGLSTRLFRYKANIEGNKKLFVSYKALENEILSYVATGCVSGEKETRQIQTKEFIHRIDDQLRKLHEYPIELEPGAIPDLSEVLKGM